MLKKDSTPRLILPKMAIQNFKRRCLASEDEILAFLIGSVTKENDVVTKIVIADLAYPDIKPEDASGDFVTWDVNDMVKIAAKVQPLQILGTVHSHPNEEPHISKADIVTAQKYGELVSGIFSYWKVNSRRRTSLDFYYGAKLLNAKLAS